MAANPQWQDPAEDDRNLSKSPVVDPSFSLDIQIMVGIVAGDESAMMRLYQKYSSLVFGLAAHVLGDPQAAEDIAQEVFLHVWRNPGSFDDSKGALASWLAVMTRNRAIDLLRRRRRECSIQVEGISDAKLQGQFEASEAARRIAEILPLMPAPQRIALGLAYFYGLSHSEISSRTGEPLGTVKSRIRLGLDFLRKTLANPPNPKYPAAMDPITTLKRK